MKDYQIETFRSLIVKGNSEPYEDFPEYSKTRDAKYWEMIQRGVSSGAIAIIKGRGWTLSYEDEHDCDCEFCTKNTEEAEEFFCTKKEAEERIKQLLKYNRYWVEDCDYELSEGPYFIKAVKQETGELFS